MVKNLPVKWENRVQSLGWEDPLEKGMATSILPYSCLENSMDRGAWQSMGSQRVWQDWNNSTHTWWLSGKDFSCQCKRRGLSPWVRKIPCRRKWQPTLVFLLGKFHGQRSLVGYSPWGHRVGQDWATKQEFIAVGNGNWHSHPGKGRDSLFKKSSTHPGSLAYCSPWCRKESDTTEQLNNKNKFLIAPNWRQSRCPIMGEWLSSIPWDTTQQEKGASYA